MFFSEYSNFKTVLTFIQQQDNLVESLEEVHIFVAVILNLVEQDNLRLGCGSKGPKQSSVLKIRKKNVIIQNANKKYFQRANIESIILNLFQKIFYQF